MGCARFECQEQAVAQPTIVAPPVGNHPGASPARIELGLPVCTRHRDETTIEHLVSDEGWRWIVQAFRSFGYVDPDRTKLTIEWRPVQ